MNIIKDARKLVVGIGLGIITTTVVQADIEVSVYDFDSVDMSGLGANGGVITATYKLGSGQTDPGLGNTFDLDFTFGAWSDSNFTFNGGDTATSSGGSYNVKYSSSSAFPVGTATTSFTIEDVPKDGLDIGWIPSYDFVELANYSNTSTSSATSEVGGQIEFTWDEPIGGHGAVRTLTYEGTDINGDETTNFTTKVDQRVNLFIPNQEIAFSRIEEVPEPSSVMLTGVSVVLLSLRRRR